MGVPLAPSIPAPTSTCSNIAVGSDSQPPPILESADDMGALLTQDLLEMAAIPSLCSLFIDSMFVNLPT